MSGSERVSETGSPAAKPRNPVERFLVRGFITVLLVLVGIEAIPWYSHHRAMTSLQTKIAAVNDNPDTPPVYEADVKTAVGGRTPTLVEPLKGTNISNGANRRDIYNWFTLNPYNKRQIYVYYGHKGLGEKDDAEVLEVQPNEQLALDLPKTPFSAEQLEAMKNMDAPAGPGEDKGGQRGPRGRRANPEGTESAAGSEKTAGDEKTDGEPPPSESGESAKPATENN